LLFHDTTAVIDQVYQYRQRDWPELHPFAFMQQLVALSIQGVVVEMVDHGFGMLGKSHRKRSRA